MNGFGSVNGVSARYNSNDDVVSPQSLGPPSHWAGSSSISNNLDSLLNHHHVWRPLPTSRSAAIFSQFPSEVIKRILWATDANGFASLCLINSDWYCEAQSLELYAYHLSRCPSYALSNNVITGPFRKNDLLRLKTRFAAEVRRNLFDAYLRPRETHINLIATNANSSAAFPGGEAFRFEFSPNGRTVLAISSSRIYVLDATSDVMSVVRELKTIRRSISASITDDGSLLAVLSSKYQANIYGLTPGQPVKHLQVIVLDHPPRTIALAHEGTVLAAAYEGGIEVFSLSQMALSTDRRAVRCEAVDSLMFSGDGSMIIGSSKNLEEPNAVVVTAPFYTENDPNITSREIHSRMWTTQILFPQISSTVSHAALLPGHLEGDAYWLFAYDHTLMTYRAVRTDDTRSGVAYFLSPPGEERFDDLSPTVPPSVTACGTLAVAGFERNGLFLYGVPERLDVSPDMGSVVEREEERMRGKVALTSATGHLEPLMAYSPSVSAESEMIDEDGLAGKVDWRQSLFVKCQPIKSIEGCNSAKWIENLDDSSHTCTRKRLIMTAPAGVSRFNDELAEEDMPIDGSRLCLLDFDYSPSIAGHREITIEVGDREAELLAEQTGNMEIEVAMERRRTVRRDRGGTVKTQLGRATTSSSPTSPRDNPSHTIPLPASPSIGPGTPMLGAVRGPPSRAQTSAGYHQARFPPRPPLGSSSFSSDQNPYNRPGGPHRGSQDSWETPPPPYLNDSASVHGAFPQTHRPMAHPTDFQPQTQSFPARPATVDGDMSGNPNFSRPNRQSASFDARSGLDVRGQAQYVTRSRSPLPGNIAEEPEPPEMNRHNLHTGQNVNHRRYSEALPPPTANNTYFTERNYTGPDDISPEESTLGLRPNMTHIPSPPPPDLQAWQQPQEAVPTPPAVRSDNRLSLTGANLQNRLNHPTPPIPMDDSVSSSYHRLAGPVQTHNDRQSYGPVAQQTSIYANAPATPSMEQLDRLNRRSLQRPQSVQQIRPTHQHHNPTSSYDFAQVQGTPPRGAWGAAGVAGSPAFTRAIAAPNGLSRNNSRGGQPTPGHNLIMPASRSTPDLLLSHSNRPSYNRLDTIQSVNSVYPMEGAARSRSFDGGIMPGMGLMSGDMRSATDSSMGESGKKIRKQKKKDKSERGASTVKEKKGFRCVVM